MIDLLTYCVPVSSADIILQTDWTQFRQNKMLSMI